MKKLILKFIRFYQKANIFHLSIFRMFYMSDRVCRFTPTCSDYTYQVVNKYGPIKGLWLGLKRIIRCNPWNKGGYNPVK